MWHYVKTEPNLWTVGFGEGENWTTDSDHDSKESAANRVAFLNGELIKEEFCHQSSSAFPSYRDTGMTLRQYFAGQALQGLLANPDWTDDEINRIADQSVLYAEALIKRLNQ